MSKEEPHFDYYFDSYAHFGIHEDMLKDAVRTGAYRDAIFNNPHLFKGKVVLDVGCGTGILSMFAAQCGASKVYAVEMSSIVESAKQIVKDNGFENVITIFQGIMEDIQIPEKVDVIVSEWMGYALLYESMLPSVIFARDRFMKQGGTMWPSHARMFIAALTDSSYRSRKIDYWDHVYGFDFSPIKEWALIEPIVDTADEESILSTYDQISDYNLNTVKVSDLSFTSPFTLQTTSDGEFDGFIVWFTVDFEGKTNVELSTSPFSTSTHWCQTIFYLREPINVSTGTQIHGTFEMHPNDKNPRDQDFNISWTVDGQEFSQSYKMR